MDSTIMVAFIGAFATILAALIGAQTVREKERKNQSLSTEIDHLRQSGYRIPVLSSEEYGINIVAPADYASVSNSFEVSGTYRVLLPGQRIWLSTFKIDNEGNIAEYWPQRPTTIRITH
jgi:hypothetical protein